MKSSKIALLILISLWVAGCGGGSGGGSPTATLVSVAVTPAGPRIPVGVTSQFAAIGTYSDGTSHDISTQVTWSSSNTAVATVNGSGLATALAAGTADIAATSGNISGSTPLTVTPATLSSISVTPANPSVPAGITRQFAALGTYSDGTNHDITAPVTWTSSDPLVATVNSSGLATALATGTITITAASGNTTGSTTVTVTPATLSFISVTPVNPSVPAGVVGQFTASGTYSDGTSHDLTTLATWASSNPSVATVNSSGLATALAAGTTSIAATLGSISGSTTLTVNPATLSSISVTPVNPGIPAGNTVQAAASGTYSDGTSRDITPQVTWNSSDTSVATVNSSGLATAVAAGSATITATSGSISGNTTLTVTAAILSSLAVAPATASIVVGTTQPFTAAGTYSDGSTQNITTQVTWTSSGTGTATITSSGLATALAAGFATITASASGKLATATLTVTSSGVGNNVLPITVNGSLCTNSYLNKPCVSVTVCTPGTTTCQTINDILLDTGSFGLRIFQSALTNVSLTPVPSGSGSLGECVQFADGSADWGPVRTADVILGNEPAVRVPIHVIDSTFGTVPTACGIPDASPSAAGFNGILGVGLFVQDCGSACVNSASIGIYYSCSGSICTGTTVVLANQVQNPVALLPQDNNGVIVQLPSIPPSGAPSVNGSLILGIGTQSNNVPSGVTLFPANRSANFTTTFNGTSLTRSFIDSGSNGLFFPPTSQLPICFSDWFCPSPAPLSLSATNTGAFGSPSGAVSFQIGNTSTLINSFNNVFPDIGGTFSSGFDWGLPFFFGRSVHVGIDGKGSSLGTGPYWAY
jgi:uncharacterized protein YjdB